MIERAIIKAIEEKFFPFESEDQLVEVLPELFASKVVKEQEKYGWKSYTFMLEQERFLGVAIITGITFVFNEVQRKLVVTVNIGEEDFPRILVVSNIEDVAKDIETELNFLYANGKNFIYVYCSTPEKKAKKELADYGFEKVRKSEMLFYLLKGNRKKAFMGSNNRKFKKPIVILKSLQTYFMNKLAYTDNLSDLNARRTVALMRDINETILFEVFFPSKYNRGILTKYKALNQRSVFIGFYIYDKLMNKVKFNEEEWHSFIQDIKFSFENEALAILSEIEEAVMGENLSTLPSSTYKHLKAASFKRKTNYRESNYLPKEDILTSIELSRAVIAEYADDLFSGNDYMFAEHKELIEKGIKEIEKISERKNIKWSDIKNENSLFDRVIQAEEPDVDDTPF